MGPTSTSPQNPTYKQVCAGDTGHVEVLDIKLAPEASYEELLRFFFRFHDPTTAARQGNDTGTQYASVIYTHSSEQASIAARVIAELQAHLDAGAAVPFETRKVTTQVLPATVFYPAHAEHQRYLEKNPGGYCNHRLRFSWESLPKL
jgi:peptide-methionine (S)-S-oxide reductase